MMTFVPVSIVAFGWPTTAMPLMVCVLCVMAIAYRYYSAFWRRRSRRWTIRAVHAGGYA